MTEVRSEFVACTHYIIWYMSDGTQRVFDLNDPKIPLPSFRSLVLLPAA